MQLAGGGAERVFIQIGKWLHKEGVEVDFVVASKQGRYVQDFPSSFELVDLGISLSGLHRTMVTPIRLWRYLKDHQPQAVMSTVDIANVYASITRSLPGLDTRFIARQANMPSTLGYGGGRIAPHILPWALQNMDDVVAVSNGVRDSLTSELGVESSKVSAIPNPVDFDFIQEKSRMGVDHPWFDSPDEPVILGVGSLTPQKDFEMLIRSFAKLRKKKNAKLIILGEGSLRGQLEELAKKLGVESDVDLPGFIANPFPYFNEASVFALSSRWEGMPNVILQAMATGTPVVATACPSGPVEILGGNFERFLCAVGDHDEMVRRLTEAINNPPKSTDLQSAISHHDIEKIGPRYANLLDIDNE